MKVYKVYLSENYQYYSANSLEDIEKLRKQDYSCVNELELKRNTENRAFVGDITVIETSQILLFSEKALSFFKSIGKFVALPKLNDFELLVPEIVDALDFGKSTIDYFSDGTRLKRVRKYVFKTDAIAEKEIFSLPIESSSTFVTDVFFEKYKKYGLTGLDFSCVFEA